VIARLIPHAAEDSGRANRVSTSDEAMSDEQRAMSRERNAPSVSDDAVKFTVGNEADGYSLLIAS
jgi:hypothetical protein